MPLRFDVVILGRRICVPYAGRLRLSNALCCGGTPHYTQRTGSLYGGLFCSSSNFNTYQALEDWGTIGFCSALGILKMSYYRRLLTYTTSPSCSTGIDHSPFTVNHAMCANALVSMLVRHSMVFTQLQMFPAEIKHTFPCHFASTLLALWGFNTGFLYSTL